MGLPHYQGDSENTHYNVFGSCSVSSILSHFLQTFCLLSLYIDYPYLLIFSLCYLHQKAELSMILRTARAAKMKMTRMSTKMRLTPTHRKESIQITIPTGRDTGLLTSPQFKLFLVNLYSCLVLLCMSASLFFLHILNSWCLMRLAMVQLVLVNLRSFFPMAGYDLLGKYTNKYSFNPPPSIYNFIFTQLFFRSAHVLPSVSRCAENTAALGAGAAEKAADLRRSPYRIHLNSPSG